MCVKPCLHTDDGYCLRRENDYCGADECRCPHTIAVLRVLDAAGNCETTAEFCEACGEQLTETKTDCI